MHPLSHPASQSSCTTTVLPEITKNCNEGASEEKNRHQSQEEEQVFTIGSMHLSFNITDTAPEMPLSLYVSSAPRVYKLWL